VALKWLGSGTAEQMKTLLQDGARAVRGAGGDGAEAWLATADRLYGEGKEVEAADAFKQALAKGGPSWSRRPRVVESLVLAQQATRRYEECAWLARQEAPTIPRGPSFANTVAIGLSCAVSAPEGAGWRKPALAALEPLGLEALRVSGLLADDRAGLYDALADAREAEGDEDGARRLAEEQWAFLERERRLARSARARAALDPMRVGCALRLGDPARALPALQASERDFPRDYNPPARLAILFGEMGRLDEALAASDRALTRAYGPRKLRVLDQRATLYEKRGDRARARSTLGEALAHAAKLPQAQRPKALLEHIESRLAGKE
jgi:tetratricopeptide (TPR) repeat protein